MNNKNNITRTVIISADARLKHILLDHTSDNDKLELSMESNLVNLRSIPKSDAYIYDVELTDNDIASTVAAISDLKKIIAKQPLILIGKKSVLNQVLKNDEITKIVARTINKPISYGQLQLVINSCLLKPTSKTDSTQQTNPSTQRRVVVFSLTIAFVLLSAITYLKTKPSPIDEKNHSVTTVNTTQKIPSLTNTDPTTQEVKKLNELALLALEQGRFVEPIENNVSYYLKLIKETDPYNATANETHNKLFQLLEASYLEQSQQGNDQGTKRAIHAILDIEPYNHKYAQLLRELKERIYLEKLDKPKVN